MTSGCYKKVACLSVTFWSLWLELFHLICLLLTPLLMWKNLTSFFPACITDPCFTMSKLELLPDYFWILGKLELGPTGRMNFTVNVSIKAFSGALFFSVRTVIDTKNDDLYRRLDGICHIKATWTHTSQLGVLNIFLERIENPWIINFNWHLNSS